MGPPSPAGWKSGYSRCSTLATLTGIEIDSSCIKNFYPSTNTILSKTKHRIARNKKRNLDSAAPSPVFDPTAVEKF